MSEAPALDRVARQRELDAEEAARDPFCTERVIAHLRRKFAESKRVTVAPVPSRGFARLGQWVSPETEQPRIGRIPDYLEAAPLEFEGSETAHEFANRIDTANRDFLADCEEHTGVELSAEEYGAMLEKRETLRSMTRKIAKRLEETGVSTMRDDGYHLWAYAVHSHTIEEIDLYRRICFLPSVAASTRARILAAVEYFIQQNRWLRFWTLTSGERCRVGEIPARLDWMLERLRKLNHKLRKKWGVSILLRTFELGTLENPDAGGQRKADGGQILFETENGVRHPTFHPHFHLIVESGRGRLPEKVWTEMCEWVRRFWGRHCDFTGGKKGAVIQNAREFVKYVTKPGEILCLSNEQIRALYEATKNRRLVRPMGRLAEQIRVRRDSCMTLRRKRTDRGWRWYEVLDHNKVSYERHTDEEKRTLARIEAEADPLEAVEFLAECDAAAAVWKRAPEVFGPCPYGFGRELPAVYDHAPGSMMEFAPHVRSDNERDFCRVVARIAPAATGTRLKEPRVIVMGTRFDIEAVRKHDLVYQLWARTVEAWEAGELLAAQGRQDAEAIYVHTGTLTVRSADDGGGPPVPERARQMAFATS